MRLGEVGGVLSRPVSRLPISPHETRNIDSVALTLVPYIHEGNERGFSILEALDGPSCIPY